MKNFLLSLALIASTSLLAQNELCDGSRFLNDTFEVDSVMGVVYGNSTSIGGVNADLKMDIYLPAADIAAERPLVILAFGGSFIFGARQDMADICRDMARKGYVAATIDYRLYDGPLFPLPDSLIMTDEVMKAVSDGKAAVRYFKEDASMGNTYHINPDMIMVGGISAGAILMDHLAYLDPTDNPEQLVLNAVEANGGWEGNSSTNTEFDTDVVGVINYSGAMRSASYIQADEAPLFSVHDDMDGVVPYANGSASILTIPIIGLQGSSLMHAQAESVNVESELITIENSTGHVSYFGTSAQSEEILNLTYDFLYPIVCGTTSGLAYPIEAIALNAFPNPTQNSFKLELPEGFEGGVLRVFNSIGALVSSQSISNTQILEVGCSAFAKGLYSVEVQSENYGQRGFSKIIVQ